MRIIMEDEVYGASDVTSLVLLANLVELSVAVMAAMTCDGITAKDNAIVGGNSRYMYAYNTIRKITSGVDTND
jgi:hypothetical protein